MNNTELIRKMEWKDLKSLSTKQISIEVSVKELQFLDEKMNWII